jgi:hypothetical protein
MDKNYTSSAGLIAAESATPCGFELLSSVFIVIALAKNAVGIRPHIHDLDLVGEEHVFVRRNGIGESF